MHILRSYPSRSSGKKKYIYFPIHRHSSHTIAAQCNNNVNYCNVKTVLNGKITVTIWPPSTPHRLLYP